MAAPTISIEEITPKIAHEMLEGNTNNRPAVRTRVETYARDMAGKKWKFTGDPIKFNGSRLLDGQHRLLACILSNTSFTTTVARGINEHAHSAMDTGQARTIAHELKWQGEKDYAALGAVLGLIWAYDNGTTGAKIASRNDLLQLLKSNESIRDALVATKQTSKKAPGVHRTSLAAVHFLVSREHGEETANKYVGEVLDGTGYEDGDPCLALRNYAANITSMRMYRPGSFDWFAVQVKAANHWLLGRPVKQLRWRRVGAAKEMFPQLVSRDEV